MDEKNKSLLYRSFEQELSPEEKENLEQALSRTEELRREKETIIQLRRTIREGKVDSFRPFFADRVLNRIQAYSKGRNDESFFDSLFMIFRPVAIAAVILIIMVTVYNITTSGQLSLESVLAVPEVTLDDAYSSSLALVIEEE
jgi:hypothetical protein